jgi:hypothetical protein
MPEFSERPSGSRCPVAEDSLCVKFILVVERSNTA